MPKFPFEMVPLPEERSTLKPRTTGLTMMVDFGVPVVSSRISWCWSVRMWI